MNHDLDLDPPHPAFTRDTAYIWGLAFILVCLHLACIRGQRLLGSVKIWYTHICSHLHVYVRTCIYIYTVRVKIDRTTGAHTIKMRKERGEIGSVRLIARSNGHV